jgi:hypothetical protein
LTPKTVETHIRHLLAKLDLPVDTTLNRRVLAVLTYLRDEHGLPSPARRAAPMTPRQILLNSSKACSTPRKRASGRDPEQREPRDDRRDALVGETRHDGGHVAGVGCPHLQTLGLLHRRLRQ